MVKNDKQSSSAKDLHNPRGIYTALESNPERKPELTIRVGAITQWVRDILAIILLLKLIAVIY